MIDAQDTRDTLHTAFLDGMSQAIGSVWIVTTDGPAGRSGVTVSAMTSVSADGEAPTLMTCLNATSSVLPLVLENGCFCVNLLRAGQNDISAERMGTHHLCIGAVKAVLCAPSGEPLVDGTRRYLRATVC